jgi:hypothetical protein
VRDPPTEDSRSVSSLAVADPSAAPGLPTELRDVVDVGVDVIEAELAARTSDVIRVADRYEVPIVTPREAERRAGIVTLAPGAQDAGPLAASLANHGLTVTTRSDLVRVAPHVGTGADTLRLFGDALAEFSSTRVW